MNFQFRLSGGQIQLSGYQIIKHYQWYVMAQPILAINLLDIPWVKKKLIVNGLSKKRGNVWQWKQGSVSSSSSHEFTEFLNLASFVNKFSCFLNGKIWKHLWLGKRNFTKNSVGNKSWPECPGLTLLEPGVHLSIVATRWSSWYSTYSTLHTANKTAKIIRNNNLFN